MMAAQAGLPRLVPPKVSHDPWVPKRVDVVTKTGTPDDGSPSKATSGVLLWPVFWMAA
jgi:hypothetical protein